MATEAEILTKVSDLLDAYSGMLSPVGGSKLLTLDRDAGSDAALSRLRQGGAERWRYGMLAGDDDFVLQWSTDGSELNFVDRLRIDGTTGAVEIALAPGDLVLSSPLQLGPSAVVRSLWLVADVSGATWLRSVGTAPLLETAPGAPPLFLRGLRMQGSVRINGSRADLGNCSLEDGVTGSFALALTNGAALRAALLEKTRPGRPHPQAAQMPHPAEFYSSIYVRSHRLRSHRERRCR